MNSNNVNLLFYSTKCKTCNVFMTVSQNNNILKHFKLICIDGQEKQFQEKGLKKVPTLVIKNMGKPIEGNDCISWLESTIKLKSNKIFDNTNDQYLPEVGITNTPNNIPMSGMSSRQINGGAGPIGSMGSGTSGGNQSGNSNQFQVPNTNVMKRSNINITQPPTLTNVRTNGQPINIGNQTNMQNQMGNQMQNQMGNQMQNQNSRSTNQSGVSAPSVKPVHQLFGFMENEMSGLSDTYAYLLVDNALPKSFLPPDKDLQIYTAPEGSKLDKKTQEIYLKNMELFRENEKKDIKRKIEEDHRNILTNK